MPCEGLAMCKAIEMIYVHARTVDGQDITELNLKRMLTSEPVQIDSFLLICWIQVKAT